MFYWVACFILKVIAKAFFSLKVYGKENVPLKGAFIFASNHLSYLDPPIAAVSINRKLSFIARDSLFRNKIFGFLLRRLNAFPIKRESADFRALREALRRLAKGKAVLIFPEGTRGVRGMEKKSNPGIGFLISKSNVPVLPVYIHGADKALPSGAKMIKRSPVNVIIGKPINSFQSQSYEEISKEIIDVIYSLPLKYTLK